MTYKGRSEAEAAYDDALAARIREAVLSRGWSFREAGEAVGVASMTVYNWTKRRGHTTPSPYNVARLCAALKMDANELLGIRRPR